MNTLLYLTKRDIRKILPKRFPDSHKGSYGKVLNVSGSINYQGAAYFSSIGALKAGAGYVLLSCPDCIVQNIASLTPDIVFLPLKSAYDGHISKNEYKKLNYLKYDVLSIGCGLSHNNDTESFVIGALNQLKNFQLPVVIDADALNILASTDFTTLPPNTILTPHPQELARLLDVTAQDINSDRAGFAKKASLKYDATIVLKGHESIICNKDLLKINKTGNNALAKAGSGDVLTGMIAGFLAQGAEPFDAACLGVYFHGLAGEAASLKHTQYGTLASDVLDFIRIEV